MNKQNIVDLETLPEEITHNKRHILPFFKLTFAYTIFYLSILIILPLLHLIFQTSSLSFTALINIITNERVLSAYKLTFLLSLAAAVINIILGLIISWTIARYEFFGKSLVEMLIDMPLALPTAIAGLTLATLYSPDILLGKYLAKYGIQIAFTNLGIVLSLVFVGLPLAVRTIEPVIRELDKDIEVAAISLGANDWQLFYKIYLPNFLPSILSAFSMCFARSLSEYGAVIFIASNIPKESETIALLIFSKIEQFNYDQATAIALGMLLISFLILYLINSLAKRIIT